MGVARGFRGWPGTAFRAAVPVLLVLAALTAAGRARADDVTCDNGAEVRDAGLCKFFVKRTNPATALVDDRLSSRIPGSDSDPPIRSFALVVGVHTYPNFTKVSDRTLPPAEADLKNLKAFLDHQKFDEIIALEDGDATRDNINYFLGVYLNKQAVIFRKRSRILFAFSGHGAPGDRDGVPGSLVLSQATDGNDFEHIYKLDELAPVLRDLGRKSFHFAALMGSCYSGGIFPQADSSADNPFYAKATGSHAMSASKADELARALVDAPGSIFFNKLMEGVNTGFADLDYSNLVQDAAGGLHLRGGGIVRLGALEGYLSSAIDKMGKNPDTGQDFPQPLLGRVVDESNSGGAFFFLGPDLLPSVVVSELTPAGAVNTSTLGLRPATTANAIAEQPELKLFNAPDSYAVQGVDVSRFNDAIDWTKLKNGPLRFAYIRASERVANRDPAFAANWSQARAAGLLTGAYHVFSFCQGAEAQFALIRQTLADAHDSAALPVAIDLEWSHGPLLAAEANCKDVASIRQSLHELENMLHSTYGKRPVIYGNSSAFADLIDDSFADNPVWLQDFRKSTGQVGPKLLGKNSWTIWQYTSNAVLPGFRGRVDVNAFFGSAADFARFVKVGENLAR